MAAAATPVELQGHMGHLTQEQQQLLEEFRVSQQGVHDETLAYLEGLDKARAVNLHQQEATQEELATLRAEREAEWPYELLRFLRAAKWKLADAQTKYAAYLAWRRREGVDTILDQFPFNAVLLKRVVGSNAAGFDKRGRPLYIEKSGSVLIDPMLTAFTDDDIVKGHIFQQEQSTVRAQASAKVRGEHVEMFTQIMDLSGLTMTAGRAAKITKLLTDVDKDMYPERMGSLFVVNAPWVFPVLYKLVKSWIDPVTRAKIHVVSGDPKEVLLQHIDAEQLPAEYGGTCNRCSTSPDCCKAYTLDDFAALLPLKASDPHIQAEAKTETIKAGKALKATVEIAEPEGGVVEWFWTQMGDKDDIDWGITFQPAEAGAPLLTVVTPVRVENTGVFSPQGSWRAPSAGVVTFSWDNGFSWMSSKQISYVVRRTEQRRECIVPEDEVEQAKPKDLFERATKAAELAWGGRQPAAAASSS